MSGTSHSRFGVDGGGRVDGSRQAQGGAEANAVKSSLRQGPIGRIVVWSAIAVVVIAAAIGITIWRYEAAISDWQRADAASGESKLAAGLISASHSPPSDPKPFCGAK